MLHTRRAFLARALCGLSLLGLPSLAAGLGRRAARRPAAAIPTALAALFHDPRSARRIGAEVLRSAHAAGGADALRARIGASGLLDGRLTLEALRARSRRDFAEGRVVHVRGWMLSETEAHLCALTVLPPAGGTERSRWLG